MFLFYSGKIEHLDMGRIVNFYGINPVIGFNFAHWTDRSVRDWFSRSHAARPRWHVWCKCTTVARTVPKDTQARLGPGELQFRMAQAGNGISAFELFFFKKMGNVWSFFCVIFWSSFCETNNLCQAWWLNQANGGMGKFWYHLSELSAPSGIWRLLGRENG